MLNNGESTNFRTPSLSSTSMPSTSKSTSSVDVTVSNFEPELGNASIDNINSNIISVTNDQCIDKLSDDKSHSQSECPSDDEKEVVVAVPDQRKFTPIKYELKYQWLYYSTVNVQVL